MHARLARGSIAVAAAPPWSALSSTGIRTTNLALLLAGLGAIALARRRPRVTRERATTADHTEAAR